MCIHIYGKMLAQASLAELRPSGRARPDTLGLKRRESEREREREREVSYYPPSLKNKYENLLFSNSVRAAFTGVKYVFLSTRVQHLLAAHVPYGAQLPAQKTEN